MLNFKYVNRITALAFLVLHITNYSIEIPVWSYFLLAFIWLLITMAGSGLIQWNYHFTSLNANRDIKNNQVAITFDDGPNPEFTPQILKLLKQYNAKATFFLHWQTH